MLNACTINRLSYCLLVSCKELFCDLNSIYTTLKLESTGGVAVRAFPSHQCDPGLSLAVLGVICEQSCLLVFLVCFKGFSPRSPVFLPPQKPTSKIPIWKSVDY